MRGGRASAVGLAAVLSGAALGCGEGASGPLELVLGVASTEALDPFGERSGMAWLEVRLEGDDPLEERVVRLDPAARRHRLADPGQPASVEVAGHALGGAAVAYGRASVDGGAVEVLFRRNLAYVMRAAGEAGPPAADAILAFDPEQRSVVDRIALPGESPRIRSLAPRGGRGLLALWQDGRQGFVAELSLDDHRWTEPIPLPGVQNRVLGVEASSTALVLGGGRVRFVDLVDRTVVDLGRPVGGRVLDAAMTDDGRFALAAIDLSPPGLLLIDVVAQTLEPQTLVPDPVAVAYDHREDVAWVVSGSTGEAVAFDPARRRLRSRSGLGFSRSMAFAAVAPAARALIGVRPTDGGGGEVLALDLDGGGLLGGALPTLPAPTAIAVDATGRRALVTAVGSSTASAGFTVVDLFDDRIEGATQLSVRDREGGRFRPGGAVMVYGR